MNTPKKLTLSLGVLGLVVGGIATYGFQSFAQTPGTSPGTSADSQQQQFDPSKGGHVGKNGVKEELLTGETADKATAAALAAVPGGKIDRVETDAEGAAYEAHMTKPDGSHVTVTFDANYQVTATEDGHGMMR